MNDCTEKYICVYENYFGEKKRELKTEKNKEKRYGNSALKKKATFLGTEKKKKGKEKGERK